MQFTQPIKDFESKYRSETNGRAKLRLHILLLRRQKYMQQEIAAIVHVTQGTVPNVCHRFTKEGWSSVHDKPRSGKPPKLTKKQLRILQKAMGKPIIEDTNIRGWFIKDVEHFIKKEFKTAHSRRHVERILHTIRMSWKVPRPKHQQQNPYAVGAFKKTSRGRPSLWLPVTKSSV